MNFFKRGSYTSISRFFLAMALCVTGLAGFSQNCPTSGTTSLSSNPNTYYPGLTATLNPGSTSISLGAATTGTNFGNTPIAAGDILLLIQMQGARINTANTANYGAGGVGGFGFTSTNMLAGNMEFVIASNALPLAGGALNLTAGIANTYVNSAFGTYGQYTYQIIRVSSYYNVQLTGTITTPLWNGSSGGVTIINAMNQVDFNGKTINAAGTGFRGGAGKRLTGQAGVDPSERGFYFSMSPTTYNANGSKGEGIAGTPRFINNSSVLLDNGVEGYPNGSFSRGGPGNAGGGGTDNRPVSNDQNSGGGGGGNGGPGGMGGWGWFFAGSTGGKGGGGFRLYAAPNTSYISPSRLIMGGGGGAGTSNNGTGNAPANDGFASSGTSGGGIVIVSALSIIGTGTIDVSGADGINTVWNDGSGGGGAGGSVLIYANSGWSGITAIADGGSGGTNTPLNAGSSTTQHGPGGGGGGGVIFSNGTLNASSSVAPGTAGLSRGVIVSLPADSSFGALAGTTGSLTQTFPAAQLPPKMRVCQGILLSTSLSNFGASVTGSGNVLVSWAVSNQLNLDHYEIERSSDGINFSSIGQVAAGQQADYAYTDYLTSVNTPIVYYRLKMADMDGQSRYSKVVPIRLDQATDAKIGVYPNPAADFTVLKIYSDNQTVARIKLIDDAGRQIISRSFTVNTGNNSLLIDQLGALPKGIYIVQVVLNNTLHNEKLIKK
jgi:hypothetical protein